MVPPQGVAIFDDLSLLANLEGAQRQSFSTSVSSQGQLYSKIKKEAHAWALAGAKHLGAILNFVE
jgi:hypothetical protein